MSRPTPDRAVEYQLAAAGNRIVVGVDECGRGSAAGPLVVVAAIAGPGQPPAGLADSKYLSRAQRERLDEQLRDWCPAFGIGQATAEEIDTYGMAVMLGVAARRALNDLAQPYDAIILDGPHNYIGKQYRVTCVIKGDATCVVVAAASIIGKVHRDNLMTDLEAAHPEYGFAANAGYLTTTHLQALRDHGPSPQHRRSWKYMDDLPRWSQLRLPAPNRTLTPPG